MPRSLASTSTDMRSSRTVRFFFTAMVCSCALTGWGFNSLYGLGLRPVHADPSAIEQAQTLLNQGESLFDDQEYVRAIRKLDPILNSRSTTRTQRVQALEITALSHLILGHKPSAEQLFWSLLEIDPYHELRDALGSQDIRDVFSSVRDRYLPAKLEHRAPKTAKAGSKLAVSVQASKDPNLVKAVLVWSRKRGTQHYHSTPLTPKADGKWRGRIRPPASKRSYQLEYYIEGLDIGHRLVALTGTPTHPVTVSVEPGSAPSQKPWHQRWYVIAAGGALVGAGTVLIFSAAN